MIRKLSIVALGALMIAAGTAYAAEPAGLNLSGLWRFDIATGRAVTLGAMTLKADGDHYRGKLITNGGIEGLDVKSVTLDGSAMVMQVGSPNGDVVFRGNLEDDGRAFSGTLTYHNGREFPMRGFKQEPAAGSQSGQARP